MAHVGLGEHALGARRWPILLLILLLWPAGGAAGAEASTTAAAQTPAREATIVVARVSASLRRHQPRLEAMADWLAGRLAGQGIVAGAAVVARDVPDMIRMLRAGEVDVVSESVLAAFRYEREAGAEILMQEWRDGQSHAQTVFFARTAAPLHRLEDLAGRRIALEDRGSTTAFLLPLATLLRAGLRPVALARPEEAVPPGAVGYVLAGSEANIAAWTAGGITDAGAFSDTDWSAQRSVSRRLGEELRAFHVTPPVLRSVVLVRAGLAAPLKDAIREALADYATAPDALRVRRRYYDVTRFSPIEGPVADELREARAIADLLLGRIE